MTEIRRVGKLPCGEIEHGFVLPRQSPLGIFDDQQSQPKGTWPIAFLCLPHGLAWQVTPDMIHLDTVQTVPPGLHEASVWQVEYECAHNNCGRHWTIYTKHSTDADPDYVVLRVLNANPTIQCEGEHVVVFDRYRMKAQHLES